MPGLDETQAHLSAESPQTIRPARSIVARFLDFVGSVRCGIALMIVFGFVCLIGMLIMQQNVEGFEHYFAELAPAQQSVYGKLGLFNVYHSWYFKLLLAALSLNIILASVNRFPSALKFLTNPKRKASPGWVASQKYTGSVLLEEDSPDTLRLTILKNYKSCGWRRRMTTENDGTTVIFGESGAWNRLGAYAVHLGLLTILFGGFLTGQVSESGNMTVSPGSSSTLLTETVFNVDRVDQATKVLPFRVYCTDIRQMLINKNGPITPTNTIDWLTTIRIEDEDHSEIAVVRTNQPFDYRGYRFFQAGSAQVGRAREIVVRAESQPDGKSQTVRMLRGGEKTLADGTKIKFESFRANFNLRNDNPNEDTTDYRNPAASLTVIEPGGKPLKAFAYGKAMADIPIANAPVAGYIFRLTEFERVSDHHILTVRRDPGSWIVYFGIAILVVSIMAVFFFSHQRVWTVIEKTPDGRVRLVIGGNTNRNEDRFEQKFSKLLTQLRVKER